MIMGFDLGGIFKSLVNPMTLLQLASGPAGWMSLAVKTLATAVAQQVIGQLGQALGLPQSVINMAQQAFSAASGQGGSLAQQTISQAVSGIAEKLNFSPTQEGEANRTLNDTLNQMVSKLSESEDFKAAKAAGGKKSSGASGNTSGGSWLMALATALGDKLNKKAEEVQKLAGEITDRTPDKTAKFGAATQDFGILMNATNNAIKTLGEGLTTTARKG
jgi:uncharacterized protein YPO0396